MLALNHTLAGATATLFTDNIFVAFFYGMLLHLVMDKVPHFWPEKKIHKGIMLGVDWALAIMVIIYIYASQGLGAGLFGAIGGYSVDFVLLSFPALRMGKVGLWHSGRQPHKTNPLYFAPEVLFTLLIGYLVLCPK